MSKPPFSARHSNHRPRDASRPQFQQKARCCDGDIGGDQRTCINGAQCTYLQPQGWLLHCCRGGLKLHSYESALGVRHCGCGWDCCSCGHSRRRCPFALQKLHYFAHWQSGSRSLWLPPQVIHTPSAKRTSLRVRIFPPRRLLPFPFALRCLSFAIVEYALQWGVPLLHPL